MIGIIRTANRLQCCAAAQLSTDAFEGAARLWEVWGSAVGLWILLKEHKILEAG
jgi:hypothetical protein